MDRAKVEASLRAHGGIHASRQRDIILDAILRSDRYVTVKDICQRVKRRHGAIGYTTVWRALELLVECGVAHKHQLGRTARYEFVSDNSTDRIVCMTCGAIVALADESVSRFRKRTATRHGFSSASQLEIRGLCDTCA